MTLAIEAIPDDPDRLCAWLEARAVGGELRAVAAELAAVHGARPPGDSLRAKLGPARLRAVLAGGLNGLAPADRQKLARHLLRQPYHLLEFQEIVLAEGGPYWDAVPRPPELLRRAAGVKAKLADALFGPIAEPLPEPPPVGPTAEPARAPAGATSRGRFRPTWGAIAATAALVFVSTFAAARLLSPPPRDAPGPAGVAWGWARPGGIPAEPDRAKYLEALAASAEQWFDEEPADAPALTRRLAEFHQGCSAFLFAPHAPLPPELRDDLRRKCRDWAQKFEGYRAALEGGENPAAVRKQADATVRKLADTLRAEAKKG